MPSRTTWFVPRTLNSARVYPTASIPLLSPPCPSPSVLLFVLTFVVLVIIGNRNARWHGSSHGGPPATMCYSAPFSIPESPEEYPEKSAAEGNQTLCNLDRRQFLAAVGGLLAYQPLTAEAWTPLLRETSIPITYSDGVYYCEYTLLGGRRSVAVVDTGSPFLIMPARWDVPNPKRTRLGTTYEEYASEEGEVVWNRAPVIMPTTAASPVVFRGVVYGVFQTYQVKVGAAGVMLGLIRNRRWDIRPTFLEQTNVKAFSLDFRQQVMTLSPKPLILPSMDSIPLLDLRSLSSCPVQHYVCVLRGVSINGRQVPTSRPIYGLIDTGCTGLLIHGRFYSPLGRLGGSFREVTVTVKTSAGRCITLQATRQDPNFLALPVNFPWLPADACLLVLGLAFLKGKVLTIDPVASRMTIV
eukprot:EG_transcript_9768